MAIGHLTPVVSYTGITSSLTVTKPTGAVAGQYCTILITANNGTNFTPPSGFTTLGTSTNGAFFGKVLDGSEGSTFTVGTTGSLLNLWAVCDVATGCDTTNPVDAVLLTQSGSGVTSFVLNQITVTSASNYLWSEATRIGSSAAITPPASMTSDWSDTTQQGSGGAHETVTPGASGTRTWTWSGSSIGVGFLMSLKAAAVVQKEYLGILKI